MKSGLLALFALVLCAQAHAGLYDDFNRQEDERLNSAREQNDASRMAFNDCGAKHSAPKKRRKK